MADIYNTMYNPDVLSCIANLSNDEVFTPPSVANAMLDLLPQELFSDPDTKFLDPACKSGVFLREIAKRLLKGLEPIYPDLQERTDHIFKNQLFGIAITELTSHLSRRSLYCSKTANGNYSVVKFDTVDGNVRFKRIEHKWGKTTYDSNGKPHSSCVFCGASKDQYDRGDELETHAYEMIHTTKPEEIFKMKFDVIISNPPYQLSDGGFGKSAKPIYQLFVQQAIKMQPRFLSMVIPSKWFTGGKGLDEFRNNMLNDKHIRKIVDYENFKDIFPGVDLAGGANYFLWDRDNTGSCEIVNMSSEGIVSETRDLDEYPVFIRSNKGVEIIRKVLSVHTGGFLTDVVSPSKPFGIRTFYTPTDKGIPCWFIQKIGLKFAKPSDITDQFGYLNKWKLLIPAAPIAGQTDFTKPVAFYYDGNTRIAKPGECCTESWLVAYASNSEEKVRSFKSYLFTKTVRFLLLQAVVSQHVTKKCFCFVPDLGNYQGEYTDEQLCEMWKLTESEFDYIKTRVGEIGGDN